MTGPAARVAASGAPVRAPRWGAGFALAFLYAQWWWVTRAGLAPETAGAGARALAAGAAAATIVRLAGHLAEAGFYRLVWRPAGRPAGFAPLFTGVAALSACDLAGAWMLATWAPGGPPVPPALAVLVGWGGLLGPGAAGYGLAAGLAASAFGSLGLLALARMAATAALLLEVAPGPPGRAAATVAAAWTVSHAALFFALALAVGPHRAP